LDLLFFLLRLPTSRANVTTARDYEETNTRALDVFEKVNQDIPRQRINWLFDHAETISEKSIDRIGALGGGIAVQHRMAYQGEYFVERYGARAAEATHRSNTCWRKA